MKYVVMVLGPLPEEMTPVAMRVAEGFNIGSDRALQLLARAPGAVTRAVPEREARAVAAVLQRAGLQVEVREESAQGPVVILEQPVAAPPERVEVGVHDADEVTDVAPEPSPHPVERSDSQRDPLRSTDGAGRTVTAPPRDPMKTTLVREPARLERGGLRRRVASAATLPAFVTLLVTLLALAVTLLPALTAEEARRASSTAHAFAATVEGLSGGLPLSAPIIRAELAQVAERSAARLSSQGIDYLLLADADGSVLAAWYQAQVGADSFPPALLERVREQAAAVLAGQAEADNGSWWGGLVRSGRRLLSMAGFGAQESAMEGTTVRRLGVTAGAVVVGASPAPLQSAVARALLTALLVGLIPVLFGVLAALSLTRSLRDAITYLLSAADSISHGNFEQSVSLERDDELGQIARAIERMRLSLQTAMERLRRR